MNDPRAGDVCGLRNTADRFVPGPGVDEAAPGDSPLMPVERVDRLERAPIAAELAVHDGNLVAICESLGLSRKTLCEKMQRHPLRPEDFGGGPEARAPRPLCHPCEAALQVARETSGA